MYIIVHEGCFVECASRDDHISFHPYISSHVIIRFRVFYFAVIVLVPRVSDSISSANGCINYTNSKCTDRFVTYIQSQDLSCD